MAEKSNNDMAPFKERTSDEIARIAFEGVHRGLQLVNGVYRGPITEDIIKAIHQRCMGELLPQEVVGRYRTLVNVGITRASITPPHWSKVPDLMEAYTDEVQERCKACGCGLDCLPAVIDTLAFIHYTFVRIHPFEDGNGRTVRLLCDLFARKYKLKPIIVWPPGREDYIDTLRAVDQSGSLAHLELFIAGCLAERYQGGVTERDRQMLDKIEATREAKQQLIREQVAVKNLSEVWAPFGWPCFD